MRRSTLYLGREGDGFFVRVTGRGDYGLGPVLEERAMQAIREGARMVVVDFQTCSYLDSTFLGALVALSCELKEVDGRIVLNCVSDWIVERLKSMGLWKMFRVVAEPFAEASPETGGPELEAVTVPTLDKAEAARYIIHAHERLAEMCPEHQEHFQHVVDALRRELGALE